MLSPRPRLHEAGAEYRRVDFGSCGWAANAGVFASLNNPLRRVGALRPTTDHVRLANIPTVGAVGKVIARASLELIV